MKFRTSLTSAAVAAALATSSLTVGTAMAEETTPSNPTGPVEAEGVNPGEEGSSLKDSKFVGSVNDFLADEDKLDFVVSSFGLGSSLLGLPNLASALKVVPSLSSTVEGLESTSSDLKNSKLSSENEGSSAESPSKDESEAKAEKAS